MTDQIVSWNLIGYQQQMTWVMGKVLWYMQKEGYITEEQRQDLLENCAIILVKKGWFSQKIDKAFGLENNQEFNARMVRLTDKPAVKPVAPVLSLVKQETNFRNIEEDQDET